jgi:small-conductance mechanosensitive channel
VLGQPGQAVEVGDRAERDDQLVAIGLSAEVPWLQSLRVAAAGVLDMGLRAPLFSLNGRDYAAVDLLLLPALIVASWAGVSLLTRLVQSQILEPAGVKRGVRDAVGAIARWLLTFVASVVVLQAWGVDLRSLAIVGSVLGVGIGFGLQHIANNLVSGLVLAIERPVRPGDFVKVGDFTGTVKRVGGRSTVIETQDQITILVPNAQLLEREVVNWSHGSPVCCVHVPVSVADGTDLSRVRQGLLDLARAHATVLREPRAQVQLRRFVDGGVTLELLVWTARPQEQSTLTSDLNFRIERWLRSERIPMPVAQRDLTLRSPALDRVASALGRQLGTNADELPQVDVPAMDEPPLADDPVAWCQVELDAVLARMRGEDGVELADRRHLFTVHRRCFVGRAAVSWLSEQLDLSRADAVRLGERLVERGAVRHVLDEQPFRDGYFFYRFVGDDARDVTAGDGIQTPNP